MSSAASPTTRFDHQADGGRSSVIAQVAGQFSGRVPHRIQEPEGLKLTGQDVSRLEELGGGGGR